MTALLARFRAARVRDRKGGLGTFIGVFTPSILTILGVILYLRTGWVVGNVGLVGALAIIILANLITLATAFSVSSVATNMEVGPGGAYYIISRSLGVEIGAAIGLPLFLAQAFSITLYAYGLAESLQYVWPELPQMPIAAVTVLLVALLAARGAGVALKLQLPIMAAIVLSLLVFFFGVARSMPQSVDLFDYVSDPAGFWTVFAVFFPAVTGIMAGISLSGDLKNPARSIPRGTIIAVVVGFVLYVSVAIALALAASPGVLVADPLIWFTIAGGAAFLIFPGLWGAIFSSAVGSVLGAPRTLEALVHDRILPGRIAARIGRIEGPGVPLLITTAIAFAAVGLGGLNAVAPILTMFFLTTYGMVNLVAGLERLSGDPSFRPTMKVHWIVSLGGAGACFWAMFLINPFVAAVALLVELGIYLLVRRRALTARWGDARRSALVSLVRSTVLQLRRLPEDPRNWRPNVLMFTTDPERDYATARFANWLVQDRGIFTVSHLIEGSITDHVADLPHAVEDLNRSLEKAGLTGFGEVEIVPDLGRGIVSVAQANGIAGIASNTVLFGWREGRDEMATVLNAIEELSLLHKSSVICRPVSKRLAPTGRTIDVWWGGLQQNGDLLVLFAHLLSLDPGWRDATINIKSIATTEMMEQRTVRSLDEMIRAARIGAQFEVIRKPENETILDIIHSRSKDADVVFLGLKEVGPDEAEEYVERLLQLMSGLRTVLFVRNAGQFRGQLLGVERSSSNLT
ncbi:MAG: Na-K-Cl cotransporter [Actinomycetota bacterium]|nr:Na-K-Cl cotransporter [Actinomycetota bacterium]